MRFRLLNTGSRSAAENMAIDEAVLTHVAAKKSPPTIRFYGWSPPAISIGYFQNLEEEVDLAACAQHGVDYVRRITGGGAVLHEHEITYSIHVPEYELAAYGIPNGILESYAKICGMILKGLAHSGLEVKFIPLNDIIVVRDCIPKKISGNAQTRKQGVLLQHGTILLKVDIEKMFSLLKVPSEKMKGKLIEDVKQRVTSLTDALGREVTFEEAFSLLKQGFMEEFPNTELAAENLLPQEQSVIHQLIIEKYGSYTWNKKR